MTHYRLSKSTRWLSTSEGGNLLNMSNGACYQVNRVGAVIAEGVTTGASVDVIVDRLWSAYGRPREALKRDIRDFIDKLIRNKLVEQCSSTSSD